MSIYNEKADNLVKLLDGLSLLEDREQEQIISIVNTLDFAYEKENIALLADVNLSQNECEKRLA